MSKVDNKDLTFCGKTRYVEGVFLSVFFTNESEALETVSHRNTLNTPLFCREYLYVLKLSCYHLLHPLKKGSCHLQAKAISLLTFPFISVPYLISLLNPHSTMLNKIGWSRHSYTVLVFR